ncbi:hypothetical protein AB4144_40515, partial [Rhizobiaceae sp. 2RAB30]
MSRRLAGRNGSKRTEDNVTSTEAPRKYRAARAVARYRAVLLGCTALVLPLLPAGEAYAQQTGANGGNGGGGTINSSYGGNGGGGGSGHPNSGGAGATGHTYGAGGSGPAGGPGGDRGGGGGGSDSGGGGGGGYANTVTVGFAD